MIFILFSIVVLLYYLKRQEDIILDLPIIILISELLIPWLHLGKTGYNTTQDVRMIYFTLLFTLYVFVRHFDLFKKDSKYFTITVIAFFFIAMFNSSNFFESFKKFLKIAPAFLTFPVYYQYFKIKPHQFSVFYDRLIMYSSIIIVSILISSIFHFGRAWGYGTNKIVHIVGLNIWGLYGVIYTVCLCLHISYHINGKKQNTKIKILSLLLGAILVLIFKRMILLTYLIGLFFYFFNGLKSKKLLYLVFAFIILISTFPLYKDTINNAIFSRMRIFEVESYYEEGRYLELHNYFTEWLNIEKLSKIYFGTEFFYSGHTDNISAVSSIMNQSGRIIHSDIANLLYTTGIIGTFLFFLMMFKYFKRIKYFVNVNNTLNNIYLFILFAFVLNLFSEGIDMNHNYYMFFAITGALLAAIQRTEVLHKKLDI